MRRLAVAGVFVFAHGLSAQAPAQAQAAPSAAAGEPAPGAVGLDPAPGEPAPAARTATLSWVRLPGAESCPSTQDVARAVEERLGRSVLVSAAAAELAVEGRIEPADGGFRATIGVADATGASLGERVIDHPAAAGDASGCAGILPSVALAIALTIDPDALARIADPEREADPDPDPGGGADLESPALSLAVPAPEPWRLEVTASLTGVLGLSPTATLGGSVRVALTPPGFVPLFVAGTLVPWSRAEPTASPPIDVLQVQVGLGICPLAFRETAPVSLFACAGLDVGALAALSARTSVTEPERVTVQANVSFDVHVSILGPLFVAGTLALLVPFRGDPLFLRGPPERVWWDPEPVAGVVGLGLGADLTL